MNEARSAWLGSPPRWPLVPLMRLTEPSRPIMYGIVLPGPDVGVGGIPLLKGGNVRPSRMNLESVAYTTPEIEAPFARARLVEGDLVYSIRGSIGDCEEVPKALEGANITQDVARVSVRPGVCRAWLRWALLCAPVRSALESQSLGAAIRGINIYDLKRAAIPVPSESQQRAIGAFLDAETEKIDALVAEQRRLMALLEEKRQAVISHAVTRGLNGSVATMPSGHDWLGETPAHWEVVKIKFTTRSIEQGWSPQCESFPAVGADEWGVLKVGCVNGGAFRPEENKLLPSDLAPEPGLDLRRGDLLVSRANTRELVGSACVVPTDFPRLLLCDKLYRLRLHGRALPAFVSYYLGSAAARGQIELETLGSKSFDGQYQPVGCSRPPDAAASAA